MSSNVSPRPLVISDWSTVSPFGIGRAAFERGIRADVTPDATEPLPWPGRSPGVSYPVPNFDIRIVLGRKGTRSMDRVSAFAVTAARDLLADAEIPEPAEIAVVLGTSGSLAAMRDFTRSSLLAEKPFYVDPAAAPSGVLNCAAGLVAIWHGLQGANSTISTGRTSGLAALSYAGRLLHTGRATRALVGATEEYSSTRAWLEYHQDEGAPASAFGEGCAMLLVEQAERAEAAGRPALAEILAVDHQICGVESEETALQATVRTVLARASISVEQVAAVIAPGTPGEPGERHRAALAEQFRPGVVRDPQASVRIGDTAAASAMFQLASALADHPPTSPRPRIVILTSADRSGAVASAVLRLGNH